MATMLRLKATTLTKKSSGERQGIALAFLHSRLLKLVASVLSERAPWQLCQVSAQEVAIRWLEPRACGSIHTSRGLTSLSWGPQEQLEQGSMPALLALGPLTEFACAFSTLMTLIVPLKALNRGDLPVDIAAELASW